MFVKICGITNESDALFSVAMGADAVGFVFAPSPRQIATALARDIARRLPPEILTVGVFRDESPQRVVEIVNQAGLRGAQLHGHESPAEARWVAQRVPFVVKAFGIGDHLLAKLPEYEVSAILIDAPTPGSGQVFDWQLAGALPLDRRVILAGGLTPENVGEAIEAVRPWGVDVSTGVEAAPGHKDALAVRYFVNAAKAYANDAEDYADLGLAELDALAAELAEEPEVYDWTEDPGVDAEPPPDDIGGYADLAGDRPAD